MFMARLLVVLTAVLLSACETVRYEYQPPASQSGKLCITQCAAIRESCRGNEIRRAEDEREACQKSSDRNFTSCMHKAANKEQEKDCDKKRTYCWASENDQRCVSEYNQCFANCGGGVNTIIEKY